MIDSKPKKYSLADISSRAVNRPNSYIIHAVEGFGKTSLAAQMPKPVFIQTRGETGLDTLINNGQLSDTPHFPEAMTWFDLLGQIDSLLSDNHDYRVFALDTLNGAERLCFEHVIAAQYEGSTSNFLDFAKGPIVAQDTWKELLIRLDRLRTERNMTIVLLAHTKVTAFKNPEGADYDRYQADMDKATWSQTHKWADAVFFGNYHTQVEGSKTNKKTGIMSKGKGVGGAMRLLYTQRDAAWDAKNRMGLAAEIDCGSSPAETWANLKAALLAGRVGRQPALPPSATSQIAPPTEPTAQ